MKKILSIAIALAAAACNDHPKYDDGSPAPLPTTEMAEDSWHVITSYDRSGSPVLDHWKNGLITANCPAGHHFEIMDLQSSEGQKALCEPNEPPADGQDRPDPTRSADGRDG